MTKTIVLDFETSLNINFSWSLWDKFVPAENIIKERTILMGSYSYLNPLEASYGKIKNISLLDTSVVTVNPYNDKELMRRFVGVLSAADVVIAHNGDSFDMKMLNARLLVNGYDPIPPVKVIDTLKIARKYFRLNSNRLGALGRVLGLGDKGDLSQQVWRDICHPKSSQKVIRAGLREMRTYCDRDVELLAQVYYKLRAFAGNHPAFNLVGSSEDACPVCTAEGSLEGNKHWLYKANTRAYEMYRCGNCNSWVRSTKAIKSTNYKKA
jgi:hypothetical protein